MIPKTDLNEAAEIVREVSDLLLATSNKQEGRAGSDLRRACGDLRARAEFYIVENEIAAKLDSAFRQATTTGATIDEFNRIRETLIALRYEATWENKTTYDKATRIKDPDNSRVYVALATHESAATGSFANDRLTTPNNWGDSISLVALLIKQGCVCFSLQQMAIVLVGTTFTSRQDVDRTRLAIGEAFAQAEEVAANEMVSDIYRALVGLHAAVTFHLYETARPLPQMLGFEFTSPRPTLILSQRLYDTAERADELRDENKVVHPAFAPRSGRALAF